jgi:hypothetical protein
LHGVLTISVHTNGPSNASQVMILRELQTTQPLIRDQRRYRLHLCGAYCSRCLYAWMAGRSLQPPRKVRKVMSTSLTFGIRILTSSADSRSHPKRTSHRANINVVMGHSFTRHLRNACIRKISRSCNGLQWSRWSSQG